MNKYSKITDIPIVVLTILEPYFKAKNKKFERINDDKFYVYFKGIGVNSDCSFSILNHEVKSDKVSLLVSYKPASENNPDETKEWVSPGLLKLRFDKWSDLIEKYNEMSLVFQDDFIEEKFASEFFNEFEFFDEDDTYFSASETLKISDVISNLNIWLEENEQKFLPSRYEEIQNEINEIQEGLTNNPKKWAAKKIAKIWAKILKQSPKLLKDITIEIIKKTTVEFIKGALIG